MGEGEEGEEGKGEGGGSKGGRRGGDRGVKQGRRGKREEGKGKGARRGYTKKRLNYTCISCGFLLSSVAILLFSPFSNDGKDVNNANSNIAINYNDNDSRNRVITATKIIIINGRNTNNICKN